MQMQKNQIVDGVLTSDWIADCSVPSDGEEITEHQIQSFSLGA
jgi:hypothetical protein